MLILDFLQELFIRTQTFRGASDPPAPALLVLVSLVLGVRQEAGLSGIDSHGAQSSAYNIDCIGRNWRGIQKIRGVGNLMQQPNAR